jgi:L-threonylcarbamoyladenylate synthase
VRCPSHPVAQALLQVCAQLGVTGVAAPSANVFGRVSPTTAAHVNSEMNAGLAPEAAQALLVLDGGPCGVGIESTIVDCTRGVPVLLRPGAVGVAALAEACGQRVWTPQEMAAGAPAPRASGTLAAHYAPQARVRLWPLADLQAALQPLARAAHEGGGRIGVYMRSRPDLDQAPDAAQWLLRAMPPDATRMAQELFAVLRAFDDAGVSQIWIEAVPDSEDWAGVADRLQRASAAA